MRVLAAAALLLVACAAAPPSRPPRPPVVSAKASEASELRETGPTLFRVALPGCTDDSLRRFRERVETLDENMHENAVPEIQALWADPCFALVARFAPPPTTTEGLAELWSRGMHGSLLAMAGGLYLRDGKRYFVLPPQAVTKVTKDDLAHRASWLCAPGESDCGHAQSYVQRAHDDFDEHETKSQYWQGPLVGGTGGLPNIVLAQREMCDVRQLPEETVPGAGKTVFESFVLCSLTGAPATWRYPDGHPLRAHDHGWLAIRGRRGHYSFSDEVRAYDLATGAAYVASSTSALVLDETEVDTKAVDAQRKPEVYTGTVSPEQVRELAFTLATDSLLRKMRTSLSLVHVPDNVMVALSGPAGGRPVLEIPDDRWNDSNNTEVAWELSEGATVVAKGDLMWPSSWQPGEDHADHLLRVLEAGLERGCPPAKLPRGVVRGRVAVNRIDADPSSIGNVYDDLTKRLENGRFCN